MLYWVELIFRDMVKYTDKMTRLERLAVDITEGMGSVKSVIIHTFLFAASFSLWFFGVKFDSILLILTTIVSLEAIYLSLFIQMSVNRNTQSLEEVEEDVAEIAEDVEEIEKDVDEIQKDVDEIAEDIDEVQKDIDEVQENVEDITEDETEDQAKERKVNESLANIESTLGKLMSEIENLKNR